ncbi:MAG: GNAT family N-acetyltransferase [Bacteroidetes bacterium]|nr:GNAT family N-acetyltransferase [Bacteroidota bacterium]
MNGSVATKDYTIERLCKDKLDDLEMLHRAISRKPHSPGYFKKKYDTAYTGVENIGFLAYNARHEPIAFYGVIPYFIRYQDQLYLAAQSADNLTHPNYRFKGLFAQLATLTFDLAREEGICLIFGFPNQNALHGFLVKLKWHLTEMMDCYNIPVTLVPAERWAKKLPITRKIYQKYQQQVLKSYLVNAKGIENSVFRDHFAGVNRNGHYLNYRTYHDTKVIKVGNAYLWIKIRNGLIIGDINCEIEHFDDMMERLYKLAFKLGLHRIQFHTSHQTQLASLFSERYESIPSYYVLFKDLGSDIPLDKIKFTYADTELF